MARSKELQIVHGIFEIMWDNGWGEDANPFIEYNDSRNVDTLLTHCLAETDRKKLDELCSKFQWDEEYDLTYDDEGICSITQSLGALFRKHDLIPVPKGKFKAKVKKKVTTTYLVKCPVCNTTVRNDFSESMEHNCPHCGAEWELEKDYE